MSADNPRGGLATALEVEALADQLGAAADVLHKRLTRDLKAHKGDFSVADQAIFRALNDDEQLLRQQANQLYAEAAALVVPALGVPQQHLMALTAIATEQIRKIGKIGDAIGLVAGLLMLVGSVLSGNGGGIVAALETIKQK
jgi:hypothetical protein